IGGGAQLLVHPNTDEVTSSIVTTLLQKGIERKSISFKPVDGSRLVRMNVRGATTEILQTIMKGQPEVELSVS
ncbi:MAG TPA: hypothetical protein VEB21_09110, partial [Terriglobales bacterium]|nr:hypothetical protein [Terriglobales bacterium]